MSFGPSRSLIAVILLHNILVSFGISSTGDFDSEIIFDQHGKKRYFLGAEGSILPLTKKVCIIKDDTSKVLFPFKCNTVLTSTAPLTPKEKRKPLLSKAQTSSSKSGQVKISLNQRTVYSYWKPASDEAPFSASSSQETVDLIDASSNQGNISPISSQISSEEKKKQQAEFSKLFRQPSKIDYNAIKEGFLKKKWPISKNGNPYIKIPSIQSPDGKDHYIVITQNPSKYRGGIEYSAYIDGKPYSDFLEHPPLSHAWFPDHDSIKRAAITIIYK
ncbi:hypothetical protein IM40_01375 [Candidatus Paracaedimonas acanthamoebae]|nr:hypothetical protein IM40_01375 [Candidatus Paracaedimonas acanthamoebae]